MKQTNAYPEKLSTTQSDSYPIFKTFHDDSIYAEDYKKAIAYAKKVKGCVYTAIDEENTTFYLKGLHYINRFGFLVVAI